jgi:hypothetical protein
VTESFSARRERFRWVLAVVLAGMLGTRGSALAQQEAYVPASGYRVQATDLKGSVAMSPGGRLAVAPGNPEGGATIIIYQGLEDRTLLQTLRAPEGDIFRYFGGLRFRDDDTLLFAENGDMDTIYQASVGTGEVRALAPRGSLPDAADLSIHPSDGRVFVATAGGPAQNAVFTVSEGTVTPIARGLGAGYLGGMAFDPAGRLFVADSADPDFSGKPGQILEIGPDGAVRRSVSLTEGGGRGAAGLAVDAEGDLLVSTGPTLSHVRLHGGARVTPFGRFAGDSPFPTGLAFRGRRFEPGSGDGVLLVDGGFTGVGGVFAVTTTHVVPVLPTDFAVRVVEFDGRNGVPGLNVRPEAALGPPSRAATPSAPDNAGVVSFGWGGSITLAFDRPILNHPGGYDFSIYGNAFYVGGDVNRVFAEPGYVEVGLDLNGNGVPDPDEPFYLLRGRPDPGIPARFPLTESLFGVIDLRTTPFLGYADVTPTDGAGDPLMPNDPRSPGIAPGSAGGDAFDLSWAVDAEGRSVTLTHADFVRITHALDARHPALGASSTEIDAASLVQPR